MRQTHPTADPGLVRLGAGMRRLASRPPVTVAPRTVAPGARPAAPSGPAKGVPASVADPGRVRLGAGMRRI